MWTVFAPIGNRINVTFSHFDVEDPHTNGTCLYDFVEIAQKEFEDVSSSLLLSNSKFVETVSLPTSFNHY
jgi:hypothetical protein